MDADAGGLLDHAGAVDPFVEMSRLTGERSEGVARIEPARRRLEPGDDAAFAVPRAGGAIEAGEAAQRRIAGQVEDVVDAIG